MPGTPLDQLDNVDGVQYQIQTSHHAGAEDATHKVQERHTDGWYEVDENGTPISLAEVIDGDVLDVDFTPSNYTPDTTPAEAADVDDMAAHLAGIDNALGVLQSLVILEEQQADGTAGGTATSGSWETRALNTEASDVGGLVSVASSQFTPVAGTYLLIARVPGYQCNGHRARLYNATQTSEVQLGSSVRSAAADSDPTDSWIVARFTANGTDAYEIQHQVETTKATSGWGPADGITVGVEVFTQVFLLRLK